jgi:hypothetical protein
MEMNDDPNMEVISPGPDLERERGREQWPNVEAALV